MQVRFENVVKRYGDVTAVSGVNLTVKSGDFLVLLGPSGCGKTTLLRMIAGLEQVTEGNIYIGDQVVNNVPPRMRDIAMVFQSYALYPHMTVRENLAFPLESRKMPKDEINRRIAGVASFLRIDTHLNKRPRQMSGGEAQRVAVGRALVRDPQVLLMDEPLSNLDAKLRLEMRVELQRLHRELKRTTVFVTHDQEEAMTLAQTIAIMNKGVLQQVGAPLDIYHRPANLFVATFVGSPQMNIFQGRVVREGTGLTFQGDGFSLPLPEASFPVPTAFGLDRDVILGVRPEAVSVRPATQGSLTVDVQEHMGRELRLYLKAGEKSLVAIAEPTSTWQTGQPVALTLHSSGLHFFDPATSQRVAGPNEPKV